MEIFSSTEIIVMIGIVSLIVFGFVMSIIIDVMNYREKNVKDDNKVNNDVELLKDDVNEILIEEENEETLNDDILIEEDAENLVMVNEEKPEDVVVEANIVNESNEVVINNIENNVSIEPEVKVEETVEPIDNNNSYIIEENVDKENELVIEPNEEVKVQNSNIIYKEGISKEEALAELEKARIKLEQEEIEEKFAKTVTNFELTEEKDAIISLDELQKISDDLYNSNEPIQYDDGNEPISINELMSQYNVVKNDEPVTQVKTEDVNEVINANKDIIVEEKEDFLTDLQETYDENN